MTSRKSVSGFVLIAIVLLVARGLATQEVHSGPPSHHTTGVDTVAGVLTALYDVISGPAGQKRDWDRMRSLFAPGARLIPLRSNARGGAEPSVWTVEDYIERSGPWLEENGFFETELHRQVRRYGNIADVFSTYECRRSLSDEQPFMRGINSIQLSFDGERWWVVSIMWQSESAAHPIPTEYLPQRAEF